MTYLLAVAVGWILYVYLGFPVVSWVLSRLFPKRVLRNAEDASSQATLPKVSVVICAYNEANEIEAKLDSLVGQSYPAEKIEVIVASDGSIDETNTIVRSYTRRQVRLLALERGGKVATLNAGVAAASGDILVFTDANSLLDAAAITYLVQEFSDPAVGGVAGDQVYLKSAAGDGSGGERAYWDLERLLKRWQNQAGSVTSATGALHALRAELFEPIPGGVTDDFAVSTLAVLKEHRLAFCEAAIAYEAPTGAQNNYARKRRIMTRGLNAVRERSALLNPFKYGIYSHQLLVQKVLRRLTFIPLAMVFVSSILLSFDSAFFALATLGQALFWVLCFLGSGEFGQRSKFLQMGGYFWTVNAAAVAATFDFVRGHRVETWDPRAGAGGASSR